MTIIRPMRRGEGGALLAMVRSLAEFHGTLDRMSASAELYESAVFASHPIVGVLMAEVEGELAGCAVWHRSFTTYRACEIMYLEDLSVLPKFRRRGISRELMKDVARLAVSMGYPRIYWLMMDWNKEARGLYEGIGAEIEPGSSYCGIQGPALEALAA